MPTIATGVLVFFHTVDEARLVHQGTCHGHKLEPVVQYLLDIVGIATIVSPVCIVRIWSVIRT